MDYSRRDRADALAADYVTGTLRGAARRRFEALLAVHPTLRDAVQAWQARLMPMTLSVEPVEPSPQVWQRIEARIHQAAAEPGPTGRWQRLAFWRGLAGVASAASLAMAVLVALPDPVLPPIVVVLNPTDAAGAAPSTIIASLSGDRRALVARPLQTVALQPDRVLELWALPAEGAPRSLGLISASSATVVSRRDALHDATGFAVSLEPPGGSPTGAPTGPVLYAGKFTL